jgi:hypothetical protein
VDTLSEPNDSDANDSNSLDERGDGVSNGRSRGQDVEGKDVLCPMDDAVDEEIVGDTMSCGFGGTVDVDAGRLLPNDAEIVVEPDRDHEEECEAGRVEEEIDLVEFCVRPSGGGVAGHDFLEEDVGRDKYEGGTECADEAQRIGCGHVERASKHNTDR